MKKLLPYLFLTLTNLVHCNLSWAAESSINLEAASKLSDLDKKIEKAIIDFNLPGLAIAVVADGQVIKTQGYGFRDLEKKFPVTENTQFSIGSSTKSFTSFLLGTLVDEGKLSWDTQVKHYLPDWVLQDEVASEYTNLTDMLSHRTGLARHEVIWLANPDLNIKTLMEKLPHLESNQEFRQSFIYNNHMYALAGHIAEKVTGRDWESLIQERILDKLNMDNTSLDYQAMTSSNNFALPYLEKNQVLVQTEFNKTLTDVMRPAGSINSSAKDMSKWLQLMVAGGIYDQKQLLQAQTLAKIQSPHTPITGFTNDAEKSPMHYGLGWFTRTYRGHYQVQHGGNIDGFTSAVLTYPNENIGIVVLTNKNASRIPHVLALDISEILLDLKPQNHLKQLTAHQQRMAQQQQSESQVKPSKTATDLPNSITDYTGSYYHPGYGQIEISEADGVLRLDYLNIREHFVHENAHNFISQNTYYLGFFEGESLKFEREEEGDIVAVSVPFDYPHPIRFTRDRKMKICVFWCVE